MDCEPRAAAAAAGQPLPLDWGALLAQHDRWLRAVVYARLGEPQAVDEVMQEVALAAVAQQAPLADMTKAAPWLYRLAVRQTLLYRRKAGRRRKLRDRFGQLCRPTEADPHTPDPLAWLLADERRRLVRQALKRIPSRDAEILLLKYSDDASYHQLAQRLGVSHSAIETRLHRARARLRAELTAMENDLDSPAINQAAT